VFGISPLTGPNHQPGEKAEVKNQSNRFSIEIKYRILKLNSTCKDLQIICINLTIDLKFELDSFDRLSYKEVQNTVNYM